MDRKILTLDTAWTAQFDVLQVPVKRSFAIFSTPRSGSQALCRLLYDAGIGIPAEYFHPDLIASYCMRFLGHLSPLTADFMKTYAKAVRDLRSRGGYFGYKIHAQQHREQRDLLGKPYEDTLRDLSIIRLVRRDVVGQIASLGAALMTGRWEDSSKKRPEQQRKVTHVTVQRWVEYIFHSEQYWNRHLERTKHPTVTVFHEDLSSIERVQDIFEVLGAPLPEKTIHDMLDKQPPRYSRNKVIKEELLDRYADLMMRHWTELERRNVQTLSSAK